MAFYRKQKTPAASLATNQVGTFTPLPSRPLAAFPQSMNYIPMTMTSPYSTINVAQGPSGNSSGGAITMPFIPTAGQGALLLANPPVLPHAAFQANAAMPNISTHPSLGGCIPQGLSVSLIVQPVDGLLHQQHQQLGHVLPNTLALGQFTPSTLQGGLTNQGYLAHTSMPTPLSSQLGRSIHLPSRSFDPAMPQVAAASKLSTMYSTPAATAALPAMTPWQWQSPTTSVSAPLALAAYGCGALPTSRPLPPQRQFPNIC